MKQVNETYFPRGGPKKELIHNKSSLFRKTGHKQKKNIMEKNEKEKLINDVPGKMQMNKIQGLSFNTLAEGMLVIGCVRGVRSRCVTVLLPDGILAQIPMTSISPAYTQALEELQQQKITEEECPPLSKLFHIGEMLCCCISNIKESGRYWPIINVSISPEHVNYGRSHSSVKVGDLLIAAVESREDHGYVMFTGIQGLMAFLKDDEAVNYIENRNHSRPLARGQVVRCMVTTAAGSDSSTIAQLTANPYVLSGLVLKSDITIEKLIPTTRVNVIVRDVQHNGLEVKVLDCSTDLLCYITRPHLQSCWSEPKDYVAGTKLTATVLYVSLPTMVFLSLKTELDGIVEQKLKNGATIENAKVAAVTTAGIYVSIMKKEDELKGFISLRHIDGSPSPEVLPLQYPVGTMLETRIINFDPIKQTYTCSSEQSFLTEKYATVSDVHVGDIVDCTVKSLDPTGARLSLGRLTVFAPVLHVSNFPVKIIKTKLAVGQQVKARVLSVREISNNIIVTLKPTLLNSEPLMSYEQACKGDQYYGVISNLCANGLYITFYNEVCGFLPTEYIGYAADITKDFVQGQLAKCYIVDVDCNKRKLTLGFTQKKSLPDQSMFANNVGTMMPSSWLKGINKSKATGDAHKTMDKIIKKGVSEFASHLTTCYQTQDYKVGTRLTGKVISSTGNRIYVEFEGNIKGILPGCLHLKYKCEQNVEVLVLWQDPTTRLLYLQPVGIFLEEQNVKSKNDIIGSHVIGRVLFSEPDMAICVLTGETPLAKLLAYIPCFPNSVLGLESEHTLIVQNVFDDYIVCLVREELIKIYNNNDLKVPEHILNTTQLKFRGKCDNEVGQFTVQEYKQDNEDTCGSKSDKQIKRKSEKSHTEDGFEFSLVRKKLKNNSPVSHDEGINIVSIESKQEKDIIKDDDVGNMNEKNVGTVEKKIIKKKKKLVDTSKVDSEIYSWNLQVDKESKMYSNVSCNNWTVVEDVRKNGMENNLFLAESGQTKNAKSKRKKMENRKKVENSNTNMNVKEEDEKKIIDSNFINKDDSSASIEILKKKKKDEKANHNILNVEGQGLFECGANSRTNKSNKKRKKFEINGESLVNGKKVKLKQNERKSKSTADGGDKQIQRSSDSIEAKMKKTKNSKRKTVLENLTLSEVGFLWDAKPEDLMVPVGDPAAADESEEDEDQSIQKLKSKSQMTAAEKRAAAKEAELMLRQKEIELLEAEVNPQSADQFDRILLSDPENAELWIKYMAYHLQATEIEKARSVARRALQTMSYRSEGERLNVWIALLNLENMYGTQESLKETLDEALRTNDDYLVNSRMLEIYANSNKSHDLEQLVNIMLRKYRESEECWLHCCTNLMNCGLFDKARNVLQRALSSLQNKAHVNLISKFALLENKHGFKEKAVTLLENVLITYPGRVDVWCVYLDMLVKTGSIDQARQVLERAANQKLTARKMKSIYSKWLSFEEKFGDENSVQHVKQAALHYVNTITSKLE